MFTEQGVLCYAGGPIEPLKVVVVPVYGVIYRYVVIAESLKKNGMEGSATRSSCLRFRPFSVWRWRLGGVTLCLPAQLPYNAV